MNIFQLSGTIVTISWDSEPQGRLVTTVAASLGALSQLIAATDGVWPPQQLRRHCVTACVFVKTEHVCAEPWIYVCFPSTATCWLVLALGCLALVWVWVGGWVCSCGDVLMSWMSVEACCVCHCICDFDSHPGAVVTCCLLLSVLSTSRNSAEIRRSMCLCCWWLSLVLRPCAPYRADCPLLTAEKRNAIYQLEWLRFSVLVSENGARNNKW